MSEAYIPSARDATIAYFGGTPDGRWRCYCVRCHDENPLREPARVYGDGYIAEPARESRTGEGEECDLCGVSLAWLGEQCQREHDEQQARWARGHVTALVEYGIPTAPRCRIY